MPVARLPEAHVDEAHRQSERLLDPRCQGRLAGTVGAEHRHGQASSSKLEDRFHHAKREPSNRSQEDVLGSPAQTRALERATKVEECRPIASTHSCPHAPRVPSRGQQGRSEAARRTVLAYGPLQLEEASRAYLGHGSLVEGAVKKQRPERVAGLENVDVRRAVPSIQARSRSGDRELEQSTVGEL